MPTDAAVAKTKVAEQIQLVPLDAIKPSPHNPRKAVDTTALTELATSIREHGLQSPIVVRPCDLDCTSGEPLPGPSKAHDGYEIVCGHRRYAAFELLELKSIPAIVRELSDDQAREVALMENLQREDIHPLEEAEAYAQLARSFFWDDGISPRESEMISPRMIARVARRVGKDIAYVTRRLKLSTLIAFARDAFLSKLITLDHALLLAKLAPEEQEKALRHTVQKWNKKGDSTESILAHAKEQLKDNKYGGWEPETIVELKRFIEDTLALDLKKATWDLTDANLLSEAGACTECQKRTGANQALFGDLTVKESTCMDSACYQAKRQAFVELRIEKEKAAAGPDGRVLKLSWKHSNSKPRPARDPEKKGKNYGNAQGWVGAEKWQDGFAPDQVFKQGQWIEAKKGECPNVLTGVTVDYDESYRGNGKPGQKKLVCVDAKCKVHKKSYSKSAGSSSGESQWERDDRRRKEAAAAEKLVRGPLIDAIVDQVKAFDDRVIRFLVEKAKGLRFVFTAARVCEQFKLKPANEEAILKEFARLKPTSARYAKIVIAVALEEYAHPYDYEDHKEQRVELLAIAKTFGVKDAAKIVAAHETEANQSALATPGKCKYCGCTEDRACQLDDGFGDTVPCMWFDDAKTVCSNPKCVKKYNAELKAKPKTKAAQKAKKSRAGKKRGH